MTIEEGQVLNETTKAQKVFPSLSWLRKRKITTIAFTVQVFFLGVEYSVVFLTLWSYINTLVRTSNAKLVYSVTTCCYLISAVIMSAILGKIVDKTREVKKVFIFSNSLAVIGNILYMIYFSPVYLIIGRLLAGCAAPLKSVISGELARSYPKDELIAKFSLVGMSYGAGFLFGPAINFAFLKVDFYISDLHVTVNNAAGLYMALIFLILDISMCFLVHNLSKEYDLKAATEKIEISHQASSSDSSNSDVSESTILLIDAKDGNKGLFSREILVILFASYYIMMLMVSCDMDLPLLIIDVLNWSLLELNIIVFSVGALGVIVMLYMAKRSLREETIYILFVLSLISCITVLGLFVIIKHYHKSQELTITLWCVWVLLFTLICVVEETYLTSAFAKMVPSRMQTFAESVRLGLARCGSITALATSVYLFDYFLYFSVVSCFVLLSILVFVIVRKNTFMYPKQRFK